MRHCQAQHCFVYVVKKYKHIGGMMLTDDSR